jgi:hypothetical protein
LLHTIFMIIVSGVVCLDATVYYSQNNYVIQKGVYDIKNGVAVANYKPTLLTNGWDILHIETGDVQVEDEIKAYGAGILEGYLTQNRIWDFYNNVMSLMFSYKKTPDNVVDFLNKQREWVYSKISMNGSDPYWKQVYFIQRQQQGLIDGYNRAANAAQKLNFIQIQSIASLSDVMDILYVNSSHRPDFDSMTTQEIVKFAQLNSHCSALIKITPNFDDILFGHNTWMAYTLLHKMWKTYTLKYAGVAANSMSFSSYPATIASTDDFYITSQSIVIMETSINIFNTSLYSLITPSSLLCWQRVMLANRMANNAPQWSHIFRQHNSGTYNNAYMTLDLKLFEPGKPLRRNTLWLSEQLPRMVTSADVTSVLRFGYWPSYNVPYFELVRNISGYTYILEKHPAAASTLSFETCARANIFRRDQSSADTVQGFKAVLRYNDFKHDPLSHGDTGLTISSRFDVVNATECSGALDAKMSSAKMLRAGTLAEIISGPSAGGKSDLPIFSWKGCKETILHNGMPDSFNFDWIKV